MNRFVVDKDALVSNIKVVQKRAGDKKLYAVVKGNGYGFGLDEYIRILYSCGVRAFAVTEPWEVQAIRHQGISDAEILMLRSTAIEQEIEQLIKNRAVLTIGSSRAAAAAGSVAARMGATPYPVHLKIDTGMGRYGFAVKETDDIISVFKYMENLKIEGMYTHLNCAFGSKKKTRAQVDSFLSVLEQVRQAGYNPGCVHYANSSAFFRFTDWDLQDAVRIGSALTGRLACTVKNSGLKRVGYLESRVCGVKWLNPGATVGYGGVYKARNAVRTAVIPLGYSHGFGVEKVRDSYRLRDGIRYIAQDLKRTIFGQKVYVRINGKPVRVLGHIGMLHTVIDVTKVDCEIGDTVVANVNPLYVNGSIMRKFTQL